MLTKAEKSVSGLPILTLSFLLCDLDLRWDLNADNLVTKSRSNVPEVLCRECSYFVMIVEKRREFRLSLSEKMLPVLSD